MFPNLNQATLEILRKRKGSKRRTDDKFRRYIQKITTSSLFNSFIMVMIVMNALVIGFETVEEYKQAHSNVFKALDEFFLAIYTMEFLMKLYAEPRGYWKSSYNIFDFTILALSYFQVIMDELNVGDKVLTPLRLLRVARTLRTISFIEGLQVLVIALIDTIRNSVLNVVILLTMLMVFFAVVGFYIFGYDEQTGDKKNWGTLSTAMLTLFTFVTVDGWTEIQKDLNTRPYSQWFTIIFIFLGHFIFTNLFIGIIIMNIHEATEKFITQQRQEREAVVQMKKDFLFQRQHDDLREMLEKQDHADEAPFANIKTESQRWFAKLLISGRSGTQYVAMVTTMKNSQYTNFEEMTHSFQQTLRNDDYVIMSDPCANLTWIEAFLTTSDHLDIYMHRCQQIQFQIANVLADMAEMKLSEKEKQELSASLKQLFKTRAKLTGVAKKVSS